MEDLLDNACWLLSWEVEMVDVDASPSPTSTQPEAEVTLPFGEEQSADVDAASLQIPAQPDAEHVTMFDEETSSIVIVDDDAPEAISVVVAKTKMLRYTEFSLQYHPGDGEEPGDVDVSNLVLTAEGTSHTLALILENNTSICLSAQTEALEMVLRGIDLYDVAAVTLSQKELLQRYIRRKARTKRVQMEDLSLYSETGRWFLSWQIEMVDMDVAPSLTHARAGAASEAGLDEQQGLSEQEAFWLNHFQQRAQLKEEQLRMDWYICTLDFAVVYAPPDGETKTINEEVTKIIILTGEHDWALQLAPSSSNRWEIEAGVSIAIPTETESMAVILQDKDSEDIAFAALSHKQALGVWTKACDPGSVRDDFIGVKMSSLLSSVGSWRLEWRIEREDKKNDRDEDLASRWQKLEALIPWDTTAEPPVQGESTHRVAAFLAQDVGRYGSNLIAQQSLTLLRSKSGYNHGNITTIEEAIENQLSFAFDPRVEQSGQMHAIAISHLGAMYHDLFKCTTLSENLDQALLFYQTAVERSSPRSITHADCLHRLAQGHHARYQNTFNVDDGARAIAALSEACASANYNPRLAESRLDILSGWLKGYEGDEVDKSGFVSGLEKAIACLRRVAEAIHEHPTHPLFFKVGTMATVVAGVFRKHWMEGQTLDDLNQLIIHQRHVVSVLRQSSTSPDYPQSLHELSELLKHRFWHTKESQDLDEAILVENEALNLAPTPLDYITVAILANLHFMRYEERLVHSTLPDDPTYKRAHFLFAVYLGERILASATIADVDEVLAIVSEGLAISQEDSYRIFLYRRTQAYAFYQKFQFTGDAKYLSSATSALVQSKDYTPEDHPLVGDSLHNLLAPGYYKSIRTFADTEHMHKMVASAEKCVATVHTSEAYHQLGYALGARHTFSRSKRDLEGSLDALSTSLQMLEAKGSSPSPELLLDLSDAITLLGFRKTDKAAYEQPRDIHHRALVSLVENIGMAVNPMEWTNHSAKDWPDMIDPIKSDLSLSLVEMEGLMRRGLKVMSVTQMLHAVWANDRQAVEGILQHAKSSHEDHSGHSYHDWLSLSTWVQLYGDDDVENSLEAYDTAIGLLAMMMGLGQTLSERHRRLTDFAEGDHWSIDDIRIKFKHGSENLSSQGVANAVQCDRMEKAVEWLEQGRCLVWNQLQTLRTPLHDLERFDPQLTQRIVRVSKCLESGDPEHGGADELDSLAKVALEEESASQAQAIREWEDLLYQARQIPGFEDFLRPTQCSTLLQNLPEAGPVVVINADELRCDAIVLVRGLDEPILVPLPEISYLRAKGMQEDLKAELAAGLLRMREKTREDRVVGQESDGYSERLLRPKEVRPRREISNTESLLGELWEAVVKPVLDALAFTTKSATPTARIWWCPTGPFTFLPVHAAGIYGRGSSSICLADYAVSSYTPTISALTARVREKRKVKVGDGRLLLVSVPEAKGQTWIPGTTTEVRDLRDLASAHEIDHLWLEGEEATAERVMEEISQSSVVHLACHGSQNAAHPMRSCFSLHDKSLELSTIIKANLKNADLAFLSACQTGTGDERLANEAVHLAAGMLAAGFKGTVATMWAINDNYAPKVAEDFYKDLLERGKEKGGGIDGEDAAFALHYATQELKKRLGGAEKSFLTWVPYVHYGL
ncbi:CHAT domain-containing protein [Coprinopsis sp. MPI-PUGE-AT-0042]|nr:CHAT domain-containing protein [Coprinopsis sp. MPI-PUGE-AT-0042]